MGREQGGVHGVVSLRKPGLLLQLPVLGENELWSLLTQVVGSRDLPSLSLADSYPSHSDSLCLLPLPSGSQGVCSSVVIVSLARWVRPGHPSGRSRNQDSSASPGLAAVVSSPHPVLRDQARWKERVAHSPSQTSCFRFSRWARS